MKATLEFDLTLPEEREDMEFALNGFKYYEVLLDYIYNKLHWMIDEDDISEELADFGDKLRGELLSLLDERELKI